MRVEPPEQDWGFPIEPCQPIGCDNGYHLQGCYYASIDDATPVISAGATVDWSPKAEYLAIFESDYPLLDPSKPEGWLLIIGHERHMFDNTWTLAAFLAQSENREKLIGQTGTLMRTERDMIALAEMEVLPNGDQAS